jgi:uncharacterized protein (DUF2062 family)
MANAAGNLWPILKPMVVGSVPLGIFAAALTYVGVRRLIGGSRPRADLHAAPQTGN